MGSLGAPEILIIAIVIFALFGYKKLPDASRSVARSLHIFKAESKDLRDSDTVAQAQPRELPPTSAPTPGVTVNGRPLSEHDPR